MRDDRAVSAGDHQSNEKGRVQGQGGQAVNRGDDGERDLFCGILFALPVSGKLFRRHERIQIFLKR